MIKTMSVFNINNKTNHTQALAFLDPNGSVTLQRYETSLDRKFERTLVTLLKLQEIRKDQTSLITQQG